MDPLDEVFTAMRVENARYARLEATAPWGLSTRRRDDTARFGLMLRGGGWLTLDDGVDGADREPVALIAGDCFVIPHGLPYTLCDDQKSATVSCSDLVRANVGGVAQIGGGGAATTIISGWFNFDPYGARPLLDLLPALLHIRMDQERTHLLQAALQLLAMETAQRGLGSGLVVSRLADIIFVQVVRAYIDTLDPDTGSGWLAALSDRRIGAALHLLHKDVASNWTVEALAAAAGMSRSGFALRFKEKVGESPLEYLTRWRMFRAGHLLRHTDKPMIDIADSVGYESEAAFNKAFKRLTGAAPGAFRRNAKLAATLPGLR
ncbi:AraC family transcriptional regulator [Undibacterium sp. Ji50W]|uniref:AraC family transcriptional regulator n=1 Tax=Undibacterium sp. Ji50W TaxID=3413041 RepID=UPI003BF25F5F